MIMNDPWPRDKLVKGAVGILKVKLYRAKQLFGTEQVFSENPNWYDDAMNYPNASPPKNMGAKFAVWQKSRYHSKEVWEDRKLLGWFMHEIQQEYPGQIERHELIIFDNDQGAGDWAVGTEFEYSGSGRSVEGHIAGMDSDEVWHKIDPPSRAERSFPPLPIYERLSPYLTRSVIKTKQRNIRKGLE